MRLPLIVLALLTMVAIAGCSGQASVDITVGTASPSLTTPAATPLSAPTVADVASPTLLATATSKVTLTPRAAAASKSPSATPTPLDIDGQPLPVPADSKETRNIPAVARNFAQNQLKGQSRIGQPYGYVVSQARDQLVASYRQQLTSAGWEAIPISGLQDPIDVLFAQKANVRATIVFATEDNGSTLMYIVATRP